MTRPLGHRIPLALTWGWHMEGLCAKYAGHGDRRPARRGVWLYES